MNYCINCFVLTAEHESWDERVDGALKKLEEEVKKLLENDKSIFRDWTNREFTKCMFLH